MADQNNQEWITLFDYDKRPIGKVLAKRNLTVSDPGFGFFIPKRFGIWATADPKQYYICYECASDERKIWAETITESEAQYFLVQNPEEYALLFGNDGLEKIDCFEPRSEQEQVKQEQKPEQDKPTP